MRRYSIVLAEPVPVAHGPSFGAFHTAEVPYGFGTLDTKLRPYGLEDRRVSDRIQAYWLNFIKTWGSKRIRPCQLAQGDEGRRRRSAIGAKSGERPAESTPERLKALRAYVADGGTLNLF